jgi:hypothetical protein
MDLDAVRRVQGGQDRSAQSRLADAIRERRAALGLTQRDVVAAGGPALSTLRQIEAAKSPGGLGRGTTLGLDRALRWPPGTAAALLAGSGEVAQLDTAGWPTAAGDWAAYVHQRARDSEDAERVGGGSDPVAATRAQGLESYSDAQLIAELARRLAAPRE